MIQIDGRLGEGGGQVLRTSLALAAITGQPFAIDQIRGGRAKPGLLRQHLTGVRAVAELCGAEVEGAELGSMTLTFRPGPVRGGDYHWAVGSAGSVMLVLQAALPPLLLAGEESTIVVEGGTHAQWAPPWPFFEETLLPLLKRMGPGIEVRMERPGFFPAGGGRIELKVRPVARLRPISLVETGERGALSAVALLSGLRERIGKIELGILRAGLGIGRESACCLHVVAPVGPGNAAWVALPGPIHTEIFTAFGSRGRPAEAVAAGLVEEVLAFLALDVPVGPHLADQLLLPMALAGEGAFLTGPLTPHSLTNAEIIGRFLPDPPRFEPVEGGRTLVWVGQRP